MGRASSASSGREVARPQVTRSEDKGLRVAHSSRVLVLASRQNNLSSDKVRESGTLSPALETSALPGLSRRGAAETVHDRGPQAAFGNFLGNDEVEIHRIQLAQEAEEVGSRLDPGRF